MNQINFVEQGNEKETIDIFNSLQANLFILKKSLMNMANCMNKYNSETEELRNEAKTWKVA